jgi:acylpyruvate hydrolase
MDTFTPLGPIVPYAEPCVLECWVDGVRKQYGSTRDMVFSVPFLISYVSRYMTLEEGDVFLTGTPEGVGPLRPNQTIECILRQDERIVSQATFSTQTRLME